MMSSHNININVTQCTDVDDTEKQKLYYAKRERYLNLRQQKDSQTPTVQIAPSATCREEPSPQTMHNYLMQSLLSIYPKPWRPRATAILIRLKERPDIITWDKPGEVKLEGESIPQSNISDFI